MRRGGYNWETAQKNAFYHKHRCPGNRSVGQDVKALAEVVIHLLKPFKNFIKTITTDNGTEFACHERISQDLEAPVYFADPYSSWQKGGIENENGLIRQYIPKSTKMEDVSHQDVNRIMHKINRRPRDT